mgnify:CR=1 FL=1
MESEDHLRLRAVEIGFLLVGERRDLCLLYTSDAADERSSVDLGGRRIIKKKKRKQHDAQTVSDTKLQET